MSVRLIKRLALAVVLVGAGCSARDDFQGATNTDPQVESADACVQLSACCAGLADDQQSMCNAGANTGDAAQCLIALRGLRGNGGCQ